MSKQTATSTMEGKRKRGRPRKRWTDEVAEDLKTLGIKNCPAVARDRREWRKILLQAKVHKGPLCSGAGGGGRGRRTRRRRRRRRRLPSTPGSPKLTIYRLQFNIFVMYFRLIWYTGSNFTEQPLASIFIRE
jgi:hypothetical protein